MAPPDPGGVPPQPLRRIRARQRRLTSKARRRGPSGGHAHDRDAGPRGHAGATPRSAFARQQRATSRARQRGPSGGHECDDGARPRERASALPRGRIDAAPQADKRDSGARPRRRTHARSRRLTPRARRCGPSGGQARDSDARLRWCVGAVPEADTRAIAAPDPEGAPARPLRRTRARQRRPTPMAADAVPQATRATAAHDTEGAPAQPLTRTCARWRRPTSRVCRRDPSGGHAREGDGRPRARRRGSEGGHARDGVARSRRHARVSPQAECA